MALIICTDSTCDLTKKIIDDNKIGVIPLYVTFNDKTYKDGVDINTDELFAKVEELNMLPKTSACSPQDFIEFFEKKLDGGKNDLIYMGIGSGLSSCLQSANIAKNSLDDNLANHIYLVDAANLSTGIGLVVLKACKFRDEGLDPETIVNKLNEIVPCVRAQFSTKDLKFLNKGGRCSSLELFLGTLMRIRPMLRVYGGKLMADEKVIGRYEKALDVQIQDLVDNIDNIDTDYLFVTHSKADEEAKYILENIPEDIKNRFAHVEETFAGSIIASHCGPHTIGILYIKKEPVVKK